MPISAGRGSGMLEGILFHDFSPLVLVLLLEVGGYERMIPKYESSGCFLNWACNDLSLRE